MKLASAVSTIQRPPTARCVKGEPRDNDTSPFGPNSVPWRPTFEDCQRIPGLVDFDTHLGPKLWRGPLLRPPADTGDIDFGNHDKDSTPASLLQPRGHRVSAIPFRMAASNDREPIWVPQRAHPCEHQRPGAASTPDRRTPAYTLRPLCKQGVVGSIPISSTLFLVGFGYHRTVRYDSASHVGLAIRRQYVGCCQIPPLIRVPAT